MSINLFLGGESQLFDDDGDPLAGGKVYFYEAGTTTLKDTYTDNSLGTANANPVILDANGRAVIWLDGEYKYKVTNSADVQIGTTVDNLNAETTADTVESGILVTNGSFETDTDLDGTPDNWTLTPLAAATIATDTTDSAHGKNSLKFTSGGNGGGTATSVLFDVLKSEVITVEFTYKASAVDVLTKVDVYTYDENDTQVSTLSAYSEAAANPTSYATHSGEVTIDATAVRAKIVITGIDATSTTKTAGTTTNIDYIKVNRVLRSDVIGDVTGDLTGNADTATVAGTITSQGALATLDTVSETEIDTDAITQSKIKTIGTGTYAGSLGNGVAVQLTLDAYCFFPMIHTTASGGAVETIVVTGHTTDGASPDNARFGLLNTGTGGTETYDVDYRYITT